jgi:hypothetical protein
MQARTQPVGLMAFVFGALSLATVTLATYLETFVNRGTWVLLQIADRLDLLADPRSAGPTQFEPPHMLDLDDFIAVKILLAFGIYLAVSGQAVALWAETRQEDNLYPAAGVACCNLSFFLCSNTAGLVALVVTTLLMLTARRIKDETTPSLGRVE